MSSSLPDEIIEENILTRLPVKSISRFRCVSKKWRLLFQNPNFIRNHLNHASLINKFNILVIGYKDNNDQTKLYNVDHDVLSSTSSSPFLGHALQIDYPHRVNSYKSLVRFYGSCNGLVCINSFPGLVCIWNPTTREYKQLPEFLPDPEPGLVPFYYAFGFGFDCNNDDYVLLRIVGYRKGDVSEAQLYSLRSDSWKNLGSIPYRFRINKGCQGVFRNGVLHWMAAGLKPYVLVCFNISDETFYHVPLPNKISNEDKGIYLSDMGTWEGKLCVIRWKYKKDPYKCKHVDVWTMMDNKWSKHLKITAQASDMFYARPIRTLNNDETLLEGGLWEEGSVGLISYDPKLERARTLVRGCPTGLFMETYTETLVALNSGAYVGQYQIQKEVRQEGEWSDNYD